MCLCSEDQAEPPSETPLRYVVAQVDAHVGRARTGAEAGDDESDTKMTDSMAGDDNGDMIFIKITVNHVELPCLTTEETGREAPISSCSYRWMPWSILRY